MTTSNQRNIDPPLYFNNTHLSETDTYALEFNLSSQSLLAYPQSPPSSESVDQNKSSLLIFKFTISPLSPNYVQNKHITEFLTMEALFMTTAVIATNIC